MKIILLALCILYSSLAFADSLNDAVDSIKKMKRPQIELPDNAEMTERAKAFIDSTYSEIRKKVDEYKQKIASDSGYDVADDESCHSEIPDKRLYIFISSSVPMNTLKSYFADAKKVKGALFLMNGVIGDIDKIMPTIDFVAKLSCGKGLNDFSEDEKCNLSQVDINSHPFRAFKIDRVPAFVYSTLSYSEIMKKVTIGEDISQDSYIKITGDVSLDYILERLANENVAPAAAMLKQLRAGFYAD